MIIQAPHIKWYMQADTEQQILDSEPLTQVEWKDGDSHFWSGLMKIKRDKETELAAFVTKMRQLGTCFFIAVLHNRFGRLFRWLQVFTVKKCVTYVWDMASRV